MRKFKNQKSEKCSRQELNEKLEKGIKSRSVCPKAVLFGYPYFSSSRSRHHGQSKDEGDDWSIVQWMLSWVKHCLYKEGG